MYVILISLLLIICLRLRLTYFFSLDCSQRLPDAQCTEAPLHKYLNGTCYNSTTFVGLWNYAVFRNKTGISRHSPSEEFYK